MVYKRLDPSADYDAFCDDQESRNPPIADLPPIDDDPRIISEGKALCQELRLDVERLKQQVTMQQQIIEGLINALHSNHKNPSTN